MRCGQISWMRSRTHGIGLGQRWCVVKPMLDPKRDLAGATPEKLARALLRPLGPRPGAKAVVCDKIPVEKIATHEPSDRVSHLLKRS